jgi:phage tail-like protein
MANPPEPLSRHQFVLQIADIDTIGFFLHCSGLRLQFDVYEYHEGGNNDFVHRLPGGISYPNLVLSRGLTNEEALLKWFYATNTKAETKDITLTLNYGTANRTWKFADAFPIAWTGPELDADGSNLPTESLEIVHSGLKI